MIKILITQFILLFIYTLWAYQWERLMEYDFLAIRLVALFVAWLAIHIMYKSID